MQNLPEEYNMLIRYATVGAISKVVVKKIDYLLEKTKGKPTTVSQPQFQVKKEEN